MSNAIRIIFTLCTTLSLNVAVEASGLRAGAASAELVAEDGMVIAGGIGPGYAQEQEGALRATAVVVQQPGEPPVAIVSCDVLMFKRDLADAAAAEVEKTCGIPATHVLIHATHTHHAPSTIRVHDYDRNEKFCKQLEGAIVKAVAAAKENLDDTTFSFRLGHEPDVGMNSRLLLGDGTIYWVGSHDDAVRPTGPFDPDLPVLVFRDPSGNMQALLFGHSSHSIGALKPGARSPSFYGMVAQTLERELGGKAAFVQGASGSTHVYNMNAAEAFDHVKKSVLQAIGQAETQEVTRVAALKRPFVFKVRNFDETAEDKAVSDYCNARIPGHAHGVIEVFRKMRRELAPLQGKEQTTWIQVVAIGDVAIVGVPAEFFTRLGMDLKARSPFKHTVVAELSNDAIGYTPDREAFPLGGYQVWTGFHSYSEPGTGERIVEQAVELLWQLARQQAPTGP